MIVYLVPMLMLTLISTLICILCILKIRGKIQFNYCEWLNFYKCHVLFPLFLQLILCSLAQILECSLKYYVWNNLMVVWDRGYKNYNQLHIVDGPKKILLSRCAQYRSCYKVKCLCRRWLGMKKAGSSVRPLHWKPVICK